MTSPRRRMAAAGLATLALGGLTASPPAAADTTSDRCYLADLHEVFLDRPASAYELERWTDVVASAPARPTVPRALAASDEWLEAVVVGIYDAALDREPDHGGLAYWIGRLRAGERVATLTAHVYGSDEVWQRAGGTAPGFVADVFPRIMGRGPSSGDMAYWPGEVARRGRGGVAKALVGSVENRRTRVTALYQKILGRAPDTSGRDFWVGRLATTDDVRLAVQLASSPEAYQRAQVDCAVPPPPTTTVVTGGTQPSLTPDVSDDGRYVAFISAAPLLPGGRGDPHRDLYLLDRTTGALTRAVEADADIGSISISGDGRHVVFVTRATDLLPSDGTALSDVFSWDRATGSVTRVTDGDHDGFPDPLSMAPTISADGRFIAFGSYARHVPEEPAGHDDFVWDRTTGTIERIEVGDTGTRLILTPDGGAVLFGSLGPVAPGERPHAEDVFAWDRVTGTFSFVGPGVPLDVAADGDVVGYDDRGLLTLIDAQTGAVTTITRYADGFTGEVEIAADGATVAFTAGGTGLFPGDTPHTPDAFVWERATGTIARVSPRGTDSASPATSGDGRIVAFQSAPADPDGAPAQITVWDRGS